MLHLHHQQCYNFRKIKLENTKWTGAVVYTWGFTVPFPPGAPCRGVNYTSLRAVSTADLIHSKYCHKHLSISKCWTLDHWILGGLVVSVTPLARLQNLPRPQTCCHSRPLSLHFHCPKSVLKSGLGPIYIS
jgi:hypothetical protein